MLTLEVVPGSRAPVPIALNQTGSRLSSLAGKQRCNAQPVRILMVDDDVSLCRAMQVILEKEGFALAIEHTVGQWLAACRGGSICDCSVGCSAARWGRERRFVRVSCSFRLPVVMMTGTGDNATREACLRRGGVGYLTKLFSICKLLTMIRLFT
jgi:twitching motility two-component system response regulator PilG